MKLTVLSSLLAAVQASGSTRYEPETHKAYASSGCGKKSPYATGTTTVGTGTYAGYARQWRVYVPASYDANKPTPVVVAHHGWTGTDSGEERSDGLKAEADKYGFISVYPQGLADNTNWGSWGSWNCVGSTQSPGPAGPTCGVTQPSYCYTSCGKCTDSPQCWWTTCADDVTPTGVGKSSVDGFIPSLYDTLEANLCIDTTREYATGISNGGMMTFQLGASLGPRLAGVVPICGSFAKGFNQAPSDGVAILATHGNSDNVVPANGTPPTSYDGYYYTPMSAIYGGDAYSPGWKSANKCSGSSSHYVTPYDGQKDLYCISEGSCSGGDVVRCAFTGGHTYAPSNGPLTWWFLSQWTKQSHVGGGCTAGEPCANRTQLENIHTEKDTDSQPSFEDVATEFSRDGHYGDPAKGCKDDEDAIPLAGGRVCAPRINSSHLDLDTQMPVPQCKLGGMRAFDNGCPTDVAGEARHGAWPQCFAKGLTSTPYQNAEFHCGLTCGPCVPKPGSIDCGKEAHSKCPGTSKCMAGELRQITMGVCTYGAEDTNIVV